MHFKSTAAAAARVAAAQRELSAAQEGLRQARLRDAESITRTPLKRPGSDNPDHYEHVAAAYRAYAHTGSPAVHIAAEADVPVTTAHRWIREARRRALLPPARHGAVSS